MKISWKNAALCGLLFLALNWIDYKDLGDIFRHGKLRYLSLFLVPVVFHFLKPKLSWAPAFFGALALFSWAVHDYMIYAGLPLILIFSVFAAACFVVDLGEIVFARLLIISGVFQSVLALLQLCGIYVLFHPAQAQDFHIPVGFMGNETVLGSFLVACICPALWRKNYLSALIMAIAILASYSQMAWASLGAVIVLFLWHKVNFSAAVGLAAVGLLALALAYIVAPGHSALSFHGRMFIWPFGLRAIGVSPLIGSGIGSWVGTYIPIYKDEILKEFHYHVPYQLHCDYLDFIVEYGLIPFVVLGGAIAQFIYRFKPTWTSAACAALLVNALANFPLCLPPTALIFVVCWAFSNKEGTHPCARMT